MSTGWSQSTSQASNRHTRDETTTFPEIGFDFRDLWVLKWTSIFASDFTLDSKYSRSEKKQVNRASGLAENSVVSENYSPFVAATINWKFSPSFTTRVNYNQGSVDRKRFISRGSDVGLLDSRTVDYSSQFTVSNSYTFRGGSRIGLPLLGSTQIKANLTMNLDFSWSSNSSEKRDPGEPVTEVDAKDDFTMQTRASYSFSQNINGGLTARWRDSSNKKANRVDHSRELGFWVEIKF
jgi:hypothetical protein